jgi:hypothetical protein
MRPLKLLTVLSLMSLTYTAVAQTVENSSVRSPRTEPSAQTTISSAHGGEQWDILPDTWVGRDALGRMMPTSADVGPIKTDHRRAVGIFYVTWHRDRDSNLTDSYVADVTRVLQEDPNARLDDKNPLWKGGVYYHWGEPEPGYFLSKDEYVIHKDISMLSDAGVDVLVMDVTNAVHYWDEWEVVFAVMEKMKAEGNKIPQFCFWAFNGPVYTVVQELYEAIYKKDRYNDLWFYWDGKPLLLCNDTGVNDGGQVVKSPNPHYEPDAATDPNNPHYGDPYYTEDLYTDYTAEVKAFFTRRTMWWGFYEWNGKRFIGTEDVWSYGYQMNDERILRMSPDELVSKHNGQPEAASVTPAQHVPTNLSMVGKSWSREFGEPSLDKYDLPDSGFVPWLGRWVQDPEAYGIYFQERWEDALAIDPPFIYINDWNEWKAYFYQIPDSGMTPFMRRQSTFFFVDQYNAEFNRDIQPMRDGYTDNYYMQMAQNIRRYKGVRPIPVLTGHTGITINGDFADWDHVGVEYRDTRGDVVHRNYPGHYGFHYRDTSGRNDIVRCKIAVDKRHVFFYVETQEPLTPSTDPNWMLLLIDADGNPETGWCGYDLLVNRNVIDARTTSLMRYEESTGQWTPVANLRYRTAGNKLEVAVPRTFLGINDRTTFTFDFHWSDNPADLKDPISLCTSGDSAPNRRFNYRCIWNQ